MGSKITKVPRSRAENGQEAFVFSSKKEMARKIVKTSREQHHKLKHIKTKYLLQLASDCIDEIERLHNVGDSIVNPTDDIDVIWVVSAPGLLLSKGSKPGWSSSYPWLDGCEQRVVGKAMNLALEITAKRVHKKTSDITREDFLKAGPWIIYNGTPQENTDMRKFLNNQSSNIPIEKTLIIENVEELDGRTWHIRNTADQAKSIHMPAGVKPRKIAICVLAAQFIRLGRLLAKEQSLPKDSKIIVVPIRSPKCYEAEHAIMESIGALVNTFKNRNAGKNSVEYLTLS